ncbi:MAG: tetratricopeptide repeat protein [Chitinivibrionales bacterium]|nr:tetratricopeptide repeat protein [Chitinivibrionales bacterium]
MRIFLSICILLLLTSAGARTSVALFPLVNKSGNELAEWISCSASEYLFRTMRRIQGIRAWDPVYLFQVDSSAWRMSSDSVLERHFHRWQWDIAVGGAFDVRNDSLQVSLRIVRIVGQNPVKAIIKADGAVGDIQSISHELLKKLLELMEIAPVSAQAPYATTAPSHSRAAYQTYLAGYGFELRSRFASALSAYARAVELDPGYGAVWYRMAAINASGGQREEAEKMVAQALAHYNDNPALIGDIALFKLQHAAPDDARRFIASHEKELMLTSSGMSALGKNHLARGEYRRGIAMLTRAVAFGPPDPEAEFNLGSGYLSVGQFSRAADIFNRLIALRPGYMRYYSLLGAAYRDAGRLMESVQILESAYRLNADNITILLNLAITYFRLMWFENALQLLNQAKRLNPELEAVQVNLAVVNWHLGNYEEANRLFERLLKKSTSRQHVYANRGNMYFLQENYRKAIRAYKKADKAGGKDERILYNLARACHLSGKLKEARFYYDEVLRLAPSRLDVLIALAQIAERRGLQSTAKDSYRHILTIAPHNEGALHGLVAILCSEDKDTEAIEAIEFFLQRYPNNKNVRKLLASTYYDMEWYEVAAMHYESLAEDFPDDLELSYGLGKSLHDAIIKKNRQKHKQALGALKKAESLPGKSAKAWLMMGNIYHEREQFTIAVDYWKKALRNASDRDMKSALRKRINTAPEK